MSTSRTLAVGLGAAAALAAVPAQAEVRTWRMHDDYVLGTSLDLAIVAGSQASAEMAAAAARAEIDRLDAILSGWRDDSELAALNRSGARAVSPDLFAVLSKAEALRETTGGAFDARIGATTAALRRGEVVAHAAPGAVKLDAATRTVTRPEGVTFDLDGVAKGYVIDKALEAARAASPDVSGVMVDIGGDLRCWGQGPGGGAWRIGVAEACETADNAVPVTVLTANDRAVAYSGRGMRDLTVDGRLVSATLNPADGRSVDATDAVCVTAAKAVEADAFATAFGVMDVDAAIAMADRTPGVETMIFRANGERRSSAGWQSLVDTRDGPRAQLIRVADGPAWPKGFQVSVGYEVPKIDAGNYRAPYLAIWVTDENKNLVRVVTMLGDNSKWIPDNYVFWRRYGRKTPDVASTARPTRAPGRYQAVWDGRDQAGKPVGQGTYTIHVEAVREHGGHSYVSSDLVVGAKPATANIPGKEELGGVTLKYGKK